MSDAARLAKAEKQRDALLAAGATAIAAIRDNLSMYQYKNEPALLEALHKLEAAGASDKGSTP